MAATLPAINSPKGSSHAIKQSLGVPSGHSNNSAKPYFLKAQAIKGKRDREMALKQATLRSQQPELSKFDTSRHHNSYKHNLFIDMLKDGFHKSFAELFSLIKQQNERRLAAGPESTLWFQTLLENEHDKLDTLKVYLCSAEAASRKSEFVEVYQCHYKLAKYFQDKGDKWLADHFFDSCLKTTSKIQSGEAKYAAEGHCNVGLSLEESGEIYDSAQHFELFYNLCKDQADWYLESGESMNKTACIHLCRIYTRIAKKHMTSGNLDQGIAFLQKASHMAEESEEKNLLGEANFKLGQAYQKNNEPQKALHCLKQYLDICQVLENPSGIGNAAEAIAKAYESQGRVEEAIKYLEMFVKVAEDSKDEKAVSRACSDLGAMFNSLGRYDQAVDFFNKAYNIARAANDTETISSSRVLFGVAAAHKMLSGVSKHIEVATKPCLARIMEWKDNRGDEFSKDIPEENA